MAVCGGEEENVALLVAPVRQWQNGTATVGRSLNGLIHGQAAPASCWQGETTGWLSPLG